MPKTSPKSKLRKRSKILNKRRRSRSKLHDSVSSQQTQQADCEEKQKTANIVDVHTEQQHSQGGDEGDSLIDRLQQEIIECRQQHSNGKAIPQKETHTNESKQKQPSPLRCQPEMEIEQDTQDSDLDGTTQNHEQGMINTENALTWNIASLNSDDNFQDVPEATPCTKDKIKLREMYRSHSSQADLEQLSFNIDGLRIDEQKVLAEMKATVSIESPRKLINKTTNYIYKALKSLQMCELPQKEIFKHFSMNFQQFKAFCNENIFDSAQRKESDVSRFIMEHEELLAEKLFRRIATNDKTDGQIKFVQISAFVHDLDMNQIEHIVHLCRDQNRLLNENIPHDPVQEIKMNESEQKTLTFVQTQTYKAYSEEVASSLNCVDFMCDLLERQWHCERGEYQRLAQDATERLEEMSNEVRRLRAVIKQMRRENLQ